MTALQLTDVRRVAIVACALGLAGCAGAGPYEPLQVTSTRFETARADPVLQEHAPVTLREAEQTLQAAEEARADGEREEMEHYTYMADRRLDLAQAQAERRQAEQQVAAFGDERKDVLLEARTREVEAIRAGTVLTLGDVLFETGQATLLPGAASQLDPLVEYMSTHPDSSVLIEGHTDSVGSGSYNQQLSQARADAVRSYLASRGIAMSRMLARGMGESIPVATNADSGGRQQNRRVEVTVQGA
jgi:outer membrane protein OmpA-like peptidoglycan-associated protein